MDLLGHVNNVTYLDYLQEARIEMLLAHDPGQERRLIGLAEGAHILRHEVQYAAPLTFRLHPVKIDTWVVRADKESFTFAHEVYDEVDGARTTYLKARTELAPYRFDEDRQRQLTDAELTVLQGFTESDLLGEAVVFTEPRDVEGGLYALKLRFSDLDAYGVVDEVQFFEFFQEARISYMNKMHGKQGIDFTKTPMVLAQMDVEYVEPVRYRTAPFEVRSWVSKVGNSSFVIESELRDGETTCSRARVVMVTFDPATQKAAPAPEELRQVILAELDA